MDVLATCLATSLSLLKALSRPPFSPAAGSSPPFCRSSKMAQDSSATHCSAVSSLSVPSKKSSVTTSSSAVLISQAVRPLVRTTPTSSTCPISRRTRRIRRSSSRMTMDCAFRASRRTSLAPSSSSALRAYASTWERSSGSSSWARAWPARRSTRVRSRWRSFSKSSTSTPMSLMGSRVGTSLAKRRRTSLRLLPTLRRCSANLASWGKKRRTAESACRDSRDTAKIFITRYFSASTSGRKGWQVSTSPRHSSRSIFAGGSVSGSRWDRVGRRTSRTVSMLAFSTAALPASPAVCPPGRVRAETITPHPKCRRPVAKSPRSILTRRPGCRKGREYSGFRMVLATLLRVAPSCFSMAWYSRAAFSSSSDPTLTARASFSISSALVMRAGAAASC
mmetsp:Transcript_16830/g.37863  ORF Transcript_16830/g.37863 Transcript_16830/m.37863 type:complete len:393 (-) Transcript_16830:1872-3050(-)